MTNSQCTSLGFSNGPYSAEEFRDKLSSPAVNDGQDVSSVCDLIHEYGHSCEDPTISYCQSELNNEGLGLNCYRDYVGRYCTQTNGNPPPWSSETCHSLCQTLNGFALINFKDSCFCDKDPITANQCCSCLDSCRNQNLNDILARSSPSVCIGAGVVDRADKCEGGRHDCQYFGGPNDFDKTKCTPCAASSSTGCDGFCNNNRGEIGSCLKLNAFGEPDQCGCLPNCVEAKPPVCKSVACFVGNTAGECKPEGSFGLCKCVTTTTTTLLPQCSSTYPDSQGKCGGWCPLGLACKKTFSGMPCACVPATTTSSSTTVTSTTIALTTMTSSSTTVVSPSTTTTTVCNPSMMCDFGTLTYTQYMPSWEYCICMYGDCRAPQCTGKLTLHQLGLV